MEHNIVDVSNYISLDGYSYIVDVDVDGLI